MAAALAAVTFAVYVPSLGNRFVNWDDLDYVADNPFLAGGLSWSSTRWSLTAFHASNWHPLTWLSHAADVSLYGREGVWGHHLSSILLHAAAAAVFLVALERLTRRLWPSAVVAALFALHPLHVESVSWISERKDVLCALFTFVALWAYARYAESPSGRRYLAVVGATAAALMSKPMAVTLPFVMLVLDWWPLRRLTRRAVVEKAPLLAMAAGAVLLTWLAQARGDAIANEVPLQTRLAHASVGYVMYIEKTFLPAPGSLVPFYPVSWRGGQTITPLMAQLACLLLAAITVAAWWLRRRRPYLLAGWLLYAGMLIPVSGLVQVGRQLMADRYTYMPLVGVFLAVVWLAADAVGARPALRRVALGAAVCVLGVLTALTCQQQAVWRDSGSLWSHVVAAYPRCAQGWLCLGHSYCSLDPVKDIRAKPDLGRAEECYRTAIGLDPDNPEALCSIGLILAEKGQWEKAEEGFRRAVEINPRFADGQYNYGVFLVSRGRTDEAIRRFRTTLEIDPGHADAMRALASIHAAETQPFRP